MKTQRKWKVLCTWRFCAFIDAVNCTGTVGSMKVGKQRHVVSPQREGVCHRSICLVVSSLDVTVIFHVMVETNNSWSGFHLGENLVEVTPNIFQLYNILELGGHEYLGWLSVWPWLSLLAPKVKVDLVKNFKKSYQVIYHMREHG